MTEASIFEPHFLILRKLKVLIALAFKLHLRHKTKEVFMYFDDEDKAIIQKISEGKVTDVESFILESCSWVRLYKK